MNTVAQQKFTAQSLGSYHNVLGLLSDDYKKFRPQKLIEATGLGVGKLADDLSVSRPSMYKDSFTLKKATRETILRLVEASDLAFELLGQDREELKKWMVAPNTLFMGASPFQVCLQGDGSSLVEWLHTRLGKRNGPAF